MTSIREPRTQACAHTHHEPCTPQRSTCHHAGCKHAAARATHADAAHMPGASPIRARNLARMCRLSQDEDLRRVEFGKLGGFLHFTGRYKPWDAYNPNSRSATLSNAGVRPCLFILQLYPYYEALAQRLLAGDASAIARRLRAQQHALVGTSTGSRGGSDSFTADFSNGDGGGSLASCIASEFLCRDGMRVRYEGGFHVCLPNRCLAQMLNLANGGLPATALVHNCSQQVNGEGLSCCAPTVVATGRRCCLSTDTSCLLPCEASSTTVCSRGHLVTLGSSTPLHASTPAGATVCLPRTCNSSTVAAASGMARRCDTDAIAETGPRCCGTDDVGCRVPACVPRRELCVGGILALGNTVCLPTTCRTAEAVGCRRRPGGERACCPHFIRRQGRQCCHASDVACVLEASELDICQGLTNRATQPASLGGDVCCAASCGRCIDDRACASRPGGAAACCPAVIRASRRRCGSMHREACAYTHWLQEMAAATIAWGVYAADCSAVDAFAGGCVGCADARTHGVALIDRRTVRRDWSTSPASGGRVRRHGTGRSARRYATWRCRGADHTFLASRVLQPRTPGTPVPASELRFWPKTQALFQLMLLAVPDADWFLKLDTDAFFNARQMRHQLLNNIPWDQAHPPDYLGKPMRIFNYKGTNLTYMQGGAYILSARAARAVATCVLGAWRVCPGRVFSDHNNNQADSWIHEHCDAPETNAEDLYVGVWCAPPMRRQLAPHHRPLYTPHRFATLHLSPRLAPSAVGRPANALCPCDRVPLHSMHEAGMQPQPHPCMVTLKAGAAKTFSSWTSRYLALTSSGNESIDAGKRAIEVMARLSERQDICTCPITAHPLKGVGLLDVARDVSYSNGCAAALDANAADDTEASATHALAVASAIKRLQTIKEAEADRKVSIRTSALAAYQAYRARRIANQRLLNVSAASSNEPCADGIVHTNPTDEQERTCCKSSCGTCGGGGCSARPGGPLRCCPAAIRRSGRLCVTPRMTGCVLPLRSHQSSMPCADGIVYHASKLHPPVCCKGTCGTCGGTNCSRRVGGRRECCIPAILRRNVTCTTPATTGCVLPSRWAQMSP